MKIEIILKKIAALMKIENYDFKEVDDLLDELIIELKEHKII